MTIRVLYPNRGGFTLVELMVSVALALVGIMGLLKAVEMVSATNLTNQIRIEAAQVGEQSLNMLLARDYRDTALDNYTASVATGIRGISNSQNYYKVRTLTQSIYTGSKNIGSKSINVTVNWVYKTKPQQHTIGGVKSDVRLSTDSSGF